MACITKRRGKWIADYRDGAGCRRVPSFDTRREAEDFLARVIPESRQVMRPAVDSNITMTVYSGRWLGLVQGHLKPRTLASYQQTLRLHILPELGSFKVRNISRSHVRTLLSEKLRTGKIKRAPEGTFIKDLRVPLARASVRIIRATLRALLNAAVDERIIAINPAERLGRHLRLVAPATARQEEIKAMTRKQLASFLGVSATAAKEYERRHYGLFLLLARTGMRLGEALALQWQDVDFPGREIRVARALSAGRIETPKSGHGRTVDMSDQLSGNLLRLQVTRKEEALKRGWGELPAWVFCTEEGTFLDESRVRKVFSKTLTTARLPGHFSPHSLRHSFASLLLQQGESPAYVQRQLGHASIQLTVDTYGRWLPAGNQAAVNRLDDPSGSKVVAKTESATSDVLEVADSIGGPSRTRTLDPLIKSQLLYQLS